MSKTKSQQAKSVKDSTTLAKAEAVNLEFTLENLSKTTLSVNETLATIGKTLVEKYAELESVQDAIKLKKEEMKELHGADKILLSISDLEAEKEKAYQDNVRVANELAEGRAREEQQFQYNLAQKRKQDDDAWAEQLRVRNNQERDRREAFEKDLKVRNELLQAQEKEYQEAIAKLATFDAELEKKVNSEVGKERGILTSKFEQEKRILAVEHGAQVSGLQKDIEHANKTIASKDTEILTLREQLAKAIQSQTELASKTVEGANDRKSLAEMQAIVTNVGGNGTRART